MKQLALIFVVLTSAVSCATRVAAPEGPPSSSKSVTFFVADDDDHLRPGVEVFLVRKGGTRVAMGRTDLSGSITIERKVLEADDALCLLFELEGFFTGAIWLPTEKFGSSFYFALAKFVIM